MNEMKTGRSTKAIRELSYIERIEPVSVNVLEGQKCTEIVAKDSREYILFKTNKDAFNHAVKMFIDNFDDPEHIEELRLTKTSIDDFAKYMVEKNGIEKYLSFDSHNRINLTVGIAYRII